MSYVRPATKNELAEILESIDYRQRDAYDLAEVLLEVKGLDIIITSNRMTGA